MKGAFDEVGLARITPALMAPCRELAIQPMMPTHRPCDATEVASGLDHTCTRRNRYTKTAPTTGPTKSNGGTSKDTVKTPKS
ncbi:hypothetical protein GCM10010212_04600 [Paenarthrobacter nicotinovorans]|nr:hypothetical protein GCM10010212_04600 [Paenarthrobacter nicotinovorans]